MTRHARRAHRAPRRRAPRLARRHTRRLVLAAVLVVLLGAGTVVALGAGGGGGLASVGLARTTTDPPPTPPPPTSALGPLPADAPLPTPAALAAVLDPLAASPALGTLVGQVSDASTGEVLWSRSPTAATVPASTAKLLTVAAALLTLPGDHTVSTRVVAGAVPGQVVLVGGGDVTLTDQPPGTDGSYPGAAHVADLAAAVRAASGAPVTSVVVDTGAYPGTDFAPGWFGVDVAGGFIAPIEPVMIDGARLDPFFGDSPRTPTPALDAGRSLARALDADPAAVTTGTAPPDAAELGSVASAPLDRRLEQLVTTSDNVLAEAVGRELAVARGLPATFDGATRAVLDTLAEAGLDTTGTTLADTSGLSVADRVTPALLDRVVTDAAGPGAPALRELLSFLPVGGASGTLAQRFGSAGTGAGWVRAKTGTLTGVNSLAGAVTDVDGRLLTFALMSTGIDGARPALDAMAAALRSCGCR